VTTETPSHTLVVRVENKPGVLARVAGLFARRGFNIVSLAVAPTENTLFSRLTIVVDAESAPLEQVVKQLDKLINVVDIRELAPAESIARELILVTVQVKDGQEDRVMKNVETFEANILSVGPHKIMVSLSGSVDQVDKFEASLEEFGIIEIQRTGTIALANIDNI